MRIDSIELTNFRCFESLHPNFHPHMNVLVGVNGSGKTSLLEALRCCLGAVVGQFSDIDLFEKNSFYFQPEDIRFSSKGRVKEFASPTSFYCEAEFDGQKIKWGRSKKGLGGKTSSDLDELTERVASLETRMKHPADGPNVELPLVAFFSCDRVSRDRKFTSKIEKLFSSRMRGYFNSLGYFTNLEYLKTWFKDRQLAKFQHGKKSEPSLELMKKVIKGIPGFTEIEYVIAPSDSSIQSDLYLFNDIGEAIGFDYLSDGQKAFVTLLTDIAMRCILLNPSMGANANETSGIVLIDEVDLHLHPAWQRKVVEALTKAFPNVQFFLTTHSPQVIGTVPPESVFILNNYEIMPSHHFTEGRDSNSILWEIFGVPPRPEEFAAELGRFYRAVEQHEIGEAESVLNHLQEKWGTLDLDIVRARMFYEDLLNDL